MKLINILAYITIISAIGLMLLFGFWMLYPYNPVEFRTTIYPILNENKTVERGGILKYRIDYCKNVKQVPIVNKKYVDGIIYDTPTGRGVVIQGCHSQIVDNLVPMNLLPGKYRMQIDVDYQMNPVRHVIYHNGTEEFIVK